MKLKYAFLGLFLATIVFIAGCSHIGNNVTKTDIKLTTQQQEQGVQVTEDGTKYLIHPSKIQGGGPGKGGIGVDRGISALAEKNIKFVSVQEADKWIEDNELVLALVYKNEKRVYPLQILVWHEIANDVVAGDPLLITYCPLCGSGIAYERKIEVDGEKITTRFGTSGKLYNSNLVMYDEETDTYWQQIDGKAIVGELTGQELKEISIDTISWRDWKAAHPDSRVLSQNTRMNRNYGKDPYGSYYEDSFLIFPVENQDSRIHPKTQIVGIEVNGKYKAYIRDGINKGEKIQDNIAGVNIEVEKLGDGRIIITNKDTGKEIVKEEDMWFAWYAFHSETELYQK
ncbi:DUF3179 domain-containing protein [Candidatus Woesearchaeota archaeon]|nr:DUF3179 domain-containing protein [Candidatus Woesearchaeota archaeon]